MAERLHLMHGTADVIVPGVISHTEPLYGYVIAGNPNYSGTLTKLKKKSEINLYGNFI